MIQELMVTASIKSLVDNITKELVGKHPTPILAV